MSKAEWTGSGSAWFRSWAGLRLEVLRMGSRFAKRRVALMLANNEGTHRIRCPGMTVIVESDRCRHWRQVAFRSPESESYETAIDQQRLSRNERRLIGGEKCNGCRDLLGPACPSEPPFARCCELG